METRVKVIPQNCIAHPHDFRVVIARSRARAHTQLSKIDSMLPCVCTVIDNR